MTIPARGFRGSRLAAVPGARDANPAGVSGPRWPALVLVAALALAGCGGGDSGSSSGSTLGSSGGTSSSGGSSSGGSSSGGGGSSGGCNYTDKITASERKEANECGIQVSASFGAADARLQQIIQACQAGSKSAADTDYAGPYTQLVTHARNTKEALSCGSSGSGGGITLPNTSSQTYYNFCATTRGNQRIGSCWGPVQKDVGGCGDGAAQTYMAQYASSSACITARDNWLKNGR